MCVCIYIYIYIYMYVYIYIYIYIYISTRSARGGKTVAKPGASGSLTHRTMNVSLYGSLSVQCTC